jgi:hypothetical protein
MKDKIMPLNCIRQWQFRKYRTAALPILIIILGFILQLSGIVIPYISILMGLSLVSYLAVIFFYRFGNPTIPEQANILVSPVNGKVISVAQANNTVHIRIAKSMFDPIELRCPVEMNEIVNDSDIAIKYGKHEIQLSFGDKTPYIFHKPGTAGGSLLGLLLGSYFVTLSFNNSILGQSIQIKKDDIVIAGETILAELIEPVIVNE